MNNIDLPTEQRETKKLPIRCHDLSEQARWNMLLCCAECHADPSLLIQEVLTEQNPLQGRRMALICCCCLELLNDWHPGRIYSSLPEHE